MAGPVSDISVTRSTLTGIRWSVAVIVLGIGLLVVGSVIKLFSDQDRCEAGNEFRRHDLPAAFELHDRHLGEALGANEVQIAAYEEAFQHDLAELLPERDCSFLF